jgi:perosamine synthetase
MKHGSELEQASLSPRVLEYVEEMIAHPQALRGQMVRGGGPIAEFEMLLAERTGFPHCLATSNATSALLVAALALNLSGKKIAVEAEAWQGSLAALEAAGAEIIEVDSLLASPLEDIAAILATDRPDHRHDAKRVRIRCDEAGIKYIEDTGCLPGVTAPVGQFSLADVQVISFGPGKPICLGEGGALLCRQQSVYERAVAMSQHPERIQAEGIHAEAFPCLNARIHPIAAVVGLELLSARCHL